MLNGAYVHIHATGHIFESICCAYDENGLFTVSVNKNLQELNNIRAWTGLLNEHDECLAIEWEISLKEKQDQQKAEDDAERRRQRAARIEERKRCEEAVKEAERLKRQQEEERIQKETDERERVRKQKEHDERLKQLQKQKEEDEQRELERRVEHERSERLKKQKEAEERRQKDKEKNKKIAEAKQTSSISSHQTFSDDKVGVTFKWEESAQRVFIKVHLFIMGD